VLVSRCWLVGVGVGIGVGIGLGEAFLALCIRFITHVKWGRQYVG
jgi:hypothetical protein